MTGMLSIATLTTLLTLNTCARGDDRMPVPFAAAPGPIVLTSKPVTVTLRPAAGTKALLVERLTALAPDQRILLVLQDVVTDQPPGVTYGVYLGATIDDAHNVGYINFFNPNSAPRTLDITDLARKLQARKQLPDPLVIGIAPRGTPAADAKPTIARVELVTQ